MGKHKKGMDMQHKQPQGGRPLLPSSTGPMTSIEAAQAQRIAELEAENARLRDMSEENPVYREGVDQAVVWFNALDLPYRESVMYVASIESFISAAIVTHKHGLKSALTGVADKYMAAFSELDRRRREVGYEPIPDHVLAHVANVHEGVQRASSGQDKGDMLTELLTGEGAPVIRKMLQELPELRKGRGTGNLDRTTEIIGYAAISHKSLPGCENKTWGQVYTGIITVLESARNPDSRRAAEILRDLEAKRSEYGKGKTPGDKVRECVAAIEKRGW